MISRTKSLGINAILAFRKLHNDTPDSGGSAFKILEFYDNTFQNLIVIVKLCIVTIDRTKGIIFGGYILAEHSCGKFGILNLLKRRTRKNQNRIFRPHACHGCKRNHYLRRILGIVQCDSRARRAIHKGDIFQIVGRQVACNKYVVILGLKRSPSVDGEAIIEDGFRCHNRCAELHNHTTIHITLDIDGLSAL